MRFLDGLLRGLMGANIGGKVTLDASLAINTGRAIPVIGLGVYQVNPGLPTEDAVAWALDAGYRHIDTAVIYHNENSVGQAIQRSGLPREEIFVTTKLTPQYQKASVGNPNDLKMSLLRLGMDYVDLYLVHFPSNHPQVRKETWQMMEQL